MRWIVQKNLVSKTFGSLADDIVRLGCDVTWVHVFPFLDKIFSTDVNVMDIDNSPEIEIDASVPSVGIGSVKLNRLLDARGVRPGGFNNDQTISVDKWTAGYGLENILNHDVKLIPLKMVPMVLDELYSNESKVFIRPAQDHKSFSGMVESPEYIKTWIASIEAFMQDGAYSPLNLDTIVAIASYKQIYAEYRCFIVNGKVVTASRYKMGDKVLYSTEVENGVINFAQSMVGHWAPCGAFVMDIASTPSGYKIIELNGFGSSGFYACDTQKVIAAIEGMYYEKVHK